MSDDPVLKIKAEKAQSENSDKPEFKETGSIGSVNKFDAKFSQANFSEVTKEMNLGLSDGVM